MSELTNIEADVKADVEKVEADIDKVLHHGEQDVSAEAQQAAEDAKSDLGDVKTDVEQEAPAVEADVKQAVDVAATDVAAEAPDVVEHPGDVVKDAEKVGEEVQAEEKPEEKQVEDVAEADAKTEEEKLKEQADAIAAQIKADVQNATAPVVATDPLEEAVKAEEAVNEKPEDEVSEVDKITLGLKKEFAERHQSMLDLREAEKDKAPGTGVTDTPENWANRLRMPPPQQVPGLPVHEV